MSEKAIKIFYSYSRQDSEMLKKLDRHLAGLKHTKKNETWHDHDIEAGSKWKPAIWNKLNTADISFC